MSNTLRNFSSIESVGTKKSLVFGIISVTSFTIKSRYPTNWYLIIKRKLLLFCMSLLCRVEAILSQYAFPDHLSSLCNLERYERIWDINLFSKQRAFHIFKITSLKSPFFYKLLDMNFFLNLLYGSLSPFIATCFAFTMAPVLKNECVSRPTFPQPVQTKTHIFFINTVSTKAVFIFWIVV